MTNTGNVDWKPDGATVTFTQEEDPTNVVVASVSADAFTLIPPGETMKQEVGVDQELSEGTYHVSADILPAGRWSVPWYRNLFRCRSRIIASIRELLSATIPNVSITHERGTDIRNICDTGTVPLRVCLRRKFRVTECMKISRLRMSLSSPAPAVQYYQNLQVVRQFLIHQIEC